MPCPERTAARPGPEENRARVLDGNVVSGGTGHQWPLRCGTARGEPRDGSDVPRISEGRTAAVRAVRHDPCISRAYKREGLQARRLGHSTVIVGVVLIVLRSCVP